MAASAALATPILSSYPVSAPGAASSVNGSPVISVGAGFTLGGSDLPLGSATVQLLTVGIATFPTSIVSAALYADSGSNPAGSALVTFTAAAGTISGAAFDLVLTPDSAFTLHAGTTYWLVLNTDPSVLGNLGWNSSGVPASGALATYAGARQSVGSTLPTGLTNANLIFEINTSAVPEPGAPGVMALSFAGLLASRRFRARR